MPGTEGGSSTNTNASRSWNILARRSARIFSFGMSARSANGLSGTKITPAFGELVKVAPSKPTKATAFCTPGEPLISSDARRTTLSVRSSVDPGGSWITVMK